MTTVMRIFGVLIFGWLLFRSNEWEKATHLTWGNVTQFQILVLFMLGMTLMYVVLGYEEGSKDD